MRYFLFSFNVKMAFLLALIFLFLFPIFLIKIQKKKLIILYSLSYFLLLFIGVLSNIEITDNTIYFSVLLTENWFNNPPSIAFFDSFLIIVNLLLLFPLGVITPLFKKTKTNIIKVTFLGFFTSIFIEFLQFSLPIIRYPELLDIINNTFSVILGYQYYLLSTKFMFRGETNDQLSKQKNNHKHKERVYKLWK